MKLKRQISPCFCLLLTFPTLFLQELLYQEKSQDLFEISRRLVKKRSRFFQKRSRFVKSALSRRTILTKKSVIYINIVYLCQTLYKIKLN